VYVHLPVLSYSLRDQEAKIASGVFCAFARYDQGPDF